jgi:xylulokinase
MKDGVLSIDLGTMGIKVSFVGFDGTIQRTAYREYPIISDLPNQAEQDPNLWWKGFLEGVRELSAYEEKLSDRVKAISICGQMHTQVYLDSKDTLLGPAITWLDQRSADVLAEWNNDGISDAIFEKTWNAPTTTYTAPQVCWVKKNRPEIFDKTRSILIAKDYIKFLLTGEKATDPSDASGAAVFDIRTNQWSDEAFLLTGLDRKLFPDVRPSAEIMGYITKEISLETGLKEGTPVVNGGSDHSVAEVGSGLLGEGEVSCIVGTAGVVAACSSKPVRDLNKRVMCWSYPLQGYWDILGITQTAASSLTWFRNAIDPDAGQDVFEKYSDAARDIPSGSEGLLFLPYLMGERTPHWDSKARGVFFGLTMKHSKANMIRAIMEGVAFSIKDCMDVVEELGVSFESVNVLGGGSKSSVWRKIQSNIYGKKVRTLETQDTGAIGNLILASLAIGLIRDPGEAANLIKHRETVRPESSEVEKYKKMFRIYRKVYQNTSELMAELEA